MIVFNDNKPIYKQIVDYAFNRVLDGTWSPGLMIPSVRELTATLGVNSRTVLKAFEELQDYGVIYPRRGMGFLLADDGGEKVREVRRKEFFDNTLPAIVSEMKLLGISSEDLIALLKSNGI